MTIFNGLTILKQPTFNRYLHNICAILLALLLIDANAVAADNAQSKTNLQASTLLNQHQSLAQALSDNPFKRPIVLQSTESPAQLKGEIYAVLDHPFSMVNVALNNPAHWCDALILHLNVKYCGAENSQNNSLLHLNLGKKDDQELADTYKATFNYQQIASAADYFSVQLKANEGPLGTSDYRIVVEATPLNKNQTFLHFTYAYSFGLAGRIAMKGYLATIGKDKVGFTRVNAASNAQPDYIQGVRGVVERNTMRYYLTIDAYLASLNQPADKQLEKRLQGWFDSTEEYALQLHELERDDYMQIKRKEYQRQNMVK